jgi:L-alanine-DL-glutamate epimerase-like enolase superfamily enzyme
VPPTPDRLVAALTDLELAIDDVACESDAVAVRSYGGDRPTSTVVLRGRGAAGRGEHVGWTVTVHEAFQRTARAVPRGAMRLGAWSAALAERVREPYERAALEAAAIDLACRQHGTNLFRLAGVTPGPVRYVVSFADLADVAAELAHAPAIELKLDAGPEFDAARYARFARIAILDFKGRGTSADHERALGAFPAALLEDPTPPWSAGVQERLSLDATIARADDVRALTFRPAAVNLKPARMGGVLEALRAAACCQERGIPVYLGGMFEIGVGRAQLRVLAACFAPDGPNDIAPIAVGDALPFRPERLPVDGGAAGFS